MISTRIKKPKIAVITLGCSKNVVDSEVLLRQLQINKAHIVEEADEAEVVVINTCGFIESARQESIEAIVEAVERKKAGFLKRVLIAGCLSERFKEELERDIPEVDAFFGTGRFREIVETLGYNFKRELLGERLLTTPKHFAYIKISEGCDHPCSFCSIPLMRGKNRSKPIKSIIDEAKKLAELGAKELIVIAQDTTSYGLDIYGERRLAQLLKRLARIEGVDWIRVMYTYPAQFPRDVLEVMQEEDNICKYIDIPIQHISDSILKLMRRGLTRRSTIKLLQDIRSKVPKIAIRTTLIAGYPTETGSEFKELCDFIKEQRFHRLGVFAYSREEGTSAHSLGDPISEKEKEERVAQIMEIQQDIVRERNESLIGSNQKVLLERIEGEFAVGRTEWDAPEIDQEVLIRNNSALRIGNFYNVKIVDTIEYDLLSECESQAEILSAKKVN